MNVKTTVSRPIVIHLALTLPPDKQHELLAFLREAISYYEAPGGIRIRLLRNVEEPSHLIEVVEYLDTPIYEKDAVRIRQADKMKEYLSRWRELVQGPVVVETYEDLTHEVLQGD
jgi:hypothetical protein